MLIFNFQLSLLQFKLLPIRHTNIAQHQHSTVYTDTNQQRRRRAELVIMKKSTEKNADTFIAAETFQGAKKGMLFRAGAKGVGYYTDPKQRHQQKKSQSSNKNNTQVISSKLLQVDLSNVLEDYSTPLAKKFETLVGRIVTAVANATAISCGVDLSKITNVLDALPDTLRTSVETQQRELTKRLVTHWNNPLCNELEFALQKRVSKEECRHLAFFPSEKQIEAYVLLVQDPPNGAPDEHPQRKLRVMFLSLLYLVHIENWRLIRNFIAAGGLMALVDHVSHKSLGIRSQAIDIVHRVTSTQYFDWFAPPSDHEGKVLHQRFLQLSNTSFVKNLLSNAPGRIDAATGNVCEPSMGSLFSLQILAFWLSWVRKLYSRNNELRLSREILGTLQRWSEVDTSHVTSLDEIDLATKVYEDFSRLPPADGVEGHHVEIENEGGEERKAGETKVRTNMTNTTNTTTNTTNTNTTTTTTTTTTSKRPKLTPKQRADRSKKLGNEAFQLGQHDAALEHYTDAIQADSSRSVLYANRAACHLARSKAASKNMNLIVMKKEAEAVVKDCNAAIRLHPTYVKAFYRRAQGKLLLEDYVGTLYDVNKGVEHAKNELSGKPPKDRTAELKRSLRTMKDWKLRALNKRDAAKRASKGWSNIPGGTLLNSLQQENEATTTIGSAAANVDKVAASSRLGLGIVDALLKRERWDVKTGGGDKSSPVASLEPDTLEPAEDGGSGSGKGGASDAKSFVNAASADSAASGTPAAPSASFGRIPIAKKTKKLKKSKSKTTTSASNNEQKQKQKKKKTRKVAAVEAIPCDIVGIGTVDPPRTAMSVEKVVISALGKDPSGKSLLEYFTVTFPPAKYRKVLKENINENILLGMIVVAECLSKQQDHEPLSRHLKGLARVRRLESTIMFLDDGPKLKLKNAIDDLVAEESISESIRTSFSTSFSW